MGYNVFFHKNISNKRILLFIAGLGTSGDLEDADSMPAGVGTILSWRLIMIFFYGTSLPSAD